jgi:CBS domain-containing protein
MVRGGFRHLVALDGDDVLGIISVRDIVRAWSQSAATANSAPSRGGDAAP